MRDLGLSEDIKIDESLRGQAEMVIWQDPNGTNLSLTPRHQDSGRLEVEVIGSAVTIRGTKCLYWTNTEKGETQKVAELHFTIPLDRCHIQWKLVQEPSE
jgi:hypothetical protein